MAHLKHRIPVRLRHNWKLVATCAAFLAICAGVFGSGTIRPYVTTVRTASATTVTQNLTGTKELFDTSVPHEVKITFRDEAYRDMLSEYFTDGEKKYVEADVTIDGTTIPSVGIRLKGNSTLAGLTWKDKSRMDRRGVPGGGRLPDGVKLPDGFQPPANAPAPGAGAEQPSPSPSPSPSSSPSPSMSPSQADGTTSEGPAPDGQTTGQRPGGGMFGATLKAEEPENLPWLIRFDEFVKGRRYQGHSQVAVRPAAMQSATLLNEALASALVGAADEPTQRTAYSSFTVNGRASTPRLIVEYLDEGYAEALGDGVLYKSLASSTFAYKGEDQTEYTADFKQINKRGERDLQPLIDLVKWVEGSSDEEFASGLAERLDVESFGRYLALQNIMLNFDDMSGPGRNYYMWYDLGTKKFRVISWDLNLAFGGDATTGVNDTVGMGFGGGGMRPGAQQPGGQGRQQGQPPQGFQPPEGFQPPANADQAGPGGPGGGGRNGGGPGGGGGPRMGHALKERFLKTAAFKAVYEEQYRALYRKLLSGGTATTLLDGIVSSYKLNAGADTAKIESEAASLRTMLQTRTETLRSDKAISGG
ncbi:CotH kinase family protein [Microtetraspora malaysiensis]|uniref:CotH kinase family protein n=1 Tax=Microtetraspora malaysiensis TaxID=161358 RepID=UPI003D903668